MNKSEFISAVAKEANITISEANRVFTSIENVIIDRLNSREKISITGFGTFDVVTRASRTGRNPQTGESISIPEREVPHFKLGKKIKDCLK